MQSARTCRVDDIPLWSDRKSMPSDFCRFISGRNGNAEIGAKLWLQNADGRSHRHQLQAGRRSCSIHRIIALNNYQTSSPNLGPRCKFGERMIVPLWSPAYECSRLVSGAHRLIDCTRVGRKQAAFVPLNRRANWIKVLTAVYCLWSVQPICISAQKVQFPRVIDISSAV